MKKTILQMAAVGLSVVAFGFVNGVQAAQYDHEVKDKNCGFAWKVEGDKLAVKMWAQTESWVGIGFNPTDMMKGANFILGYVKDGKVEIDDDFGTGATSHQSDEKLGGTSDVTVVGGSEEGGVTTIEFAMPVKSADKNDTEINVNGDNVVLFAYGVGRDSFKSKHKFRAEYKVNFATGASSEVD